MKLRTTTPASTSTYLARVTAIVALVVMAVAVPVQYFASRPSIASADQYDAKIQALKQKVSDYQKQADALGQQAATLQNALGQISADKAAIQTQIDLYQVQYDQLVKDIDATKKRIEENRKSTGQLIVASSMSGDVPLIVRLASSENLADYIDNEASRARIRDSIVQKTEESTKLKQQLEQKQSDVKKVLDEQKTKRQELSDKEALQSRLLDETKGNEESYKNLVNQSNSQISSLQEQQRQAARQFQNSNGGIASSSPTNSSVVYKNFDGEYNCGGGYSFCSYYHDQFVPDRWGLKLARECVHYTADFLERNGYYIPDGAFATYGSAYQWVSTAVNGNGVTGQKFASLVSTPQYGDIVYMPIGGVGHVAVVEQNYGNGWIKVSQFNFGVTGKYSTMDVKITGNLSFLRFNK